MKHILRRVRRGWRALINHVVKGGFAWQSVPHRRFQ